jgi:magnesium-transporting ATPase (P-type)
VHIVALVAIAVGLLSIVANMLSPVQRSVAEILQNSSTALFAQVPEGLLPTVTISLMIASKQLSRRSVLVRKLDAVETLGCVSVICSDKTGTLTTGEMSAVTLVVPKDTANSLPRRRYSQPDAINPLQRLEPSHDDELELFAASRVDGIFDKDSAASRNLQSLCICGLLNNGAVLTGEADIQGDGPIAPGSSREWTERWKATGSPTEVAILRASVECLGGLAGAMQLRGEFGLVHEVPFNSENKWMLTIHTHPQAASSDCQFQCILKGAPERVLSKCILSGDERHHIDEKLKDLMCRGLRVLCFATRSVADNGSGLPSFRDLESSDTGASGWN